MMENPGFEVGQLAELKTFEVGYRGAWFRCKIKDITLDKNKICLEYYDFDSREVSWEEIYQVPPYHRRSKHAKKELMVRPQYPVLHSKSAMPAVVSETCVVTDGIYKVDDMVDWFADGCFWCARIIQVFNDESCQVELPMPPAGEGGKHVVNFKELRPSLNWSEKQGWRLPTDEGQTPCDAHLIFPTKQGIDMEVEHTAATASSPVNASSTTRISAEEGRHKEKNENGKMYGDLVESSESTSTLKAIPTAADEINKNPSKNSTVIHDDDEEKEVENDITKDLNIMHEDTPEAAILDFEELVCKVEWMQRILQSTTTATSSWKFA